MEFRRRRRTPDVGLAGDPGLGTLRGILMPWPRLEIAEFFIQYLVEFAEVFDHLIVRVTVIGGDVMPRTMAQRSPDDRDLALAEQIARILQVDEVLQLERHVMHLGRAATDEIHRVVIAVAA